MLYSNSDLYQKHCKILIITNQFSTLNLGLKSKIIAPPATLTSEMGRNLSSAKSEVQMVSLLETVIHQDIQSKL